MLFTLIIGLIRPNQWLVFGGVNGLDLNKDYDDQPTGPSGPTEPAEP